MIDFDALPTVLRILVMAFTAWHMLYAIVFMGSAFEKIFQKSWGCLELRREMWWMEVHVAYPGLLIFWAITASSFIEYLLLAANTYLWQDWYRNHDHDDRWKKRRKKALSKVKQVAGKLVVVPIPAPSGV